MNATEPQGRLERVSSTETQGEAGASGTNGKLKARLEPGNERHCLRHQIGDNLIAPCDGVHGIGKVVFHLQADRAVIADVLQDAKEIGE